MRTGPDKTFPVTCDGCGAQYECTRPNRGKTHHCSEICRQWSQFGAWSVKIPRDHIMHWLNQSCQWSDKRLLTKPCDWCGDPFDQVVTRQRFCSPAHKRRSKAARRRALEFNAVGSYTWAEITRLWRIFDRRCAYCAHATSLSDIQAEHVHPLSRGGRDDISNLLPSCGACNADKRDLLLADWTRDRVRRALTPVRTTWTATDRRYSHLVLYQPTFEHLSQVA